MPLVPAQTNIHGLCSGGDQLCLSLGLKVIQLYWFPGVLTSLYCQMRLGSDPAVGETLTLAGFCSPQATPRFSGWAEKPRFTESGAITQLFHQPWSLFCPQTLAELLVEKPEVGRPEPC